MAQITGIPLRMQAPPRTDDINVLRDYVAQLANYFAILVKEIDFTVNGNIDADNIKAAAITAEKIAAGAITADSIQVDELSALSSNLGTITAGLMQAVTIIGAYIATANGTYPRTEMSSTNNLFGAYSAPGVGVEIVPSYISDKPAFRIVDGGIPAGHLALLASGNIILDATNALTISANDNVYMSSLGFQGFVFENFYNIYSTAASTSLGNILDDLDSRISALE